ncbi:MAG: hypothetical protein DWQ34_08540 [Planctomycetota bacterium]|nr:MAG: hypothetical protein DWQ29_12385 [Planctomycetota bacterium]REJ94471.1 MAG: hypothetical protein DWQ34_08540 [Planctomycetota bacterium]REK22580.1 MAG: hypothetical protein DWQ41_19040 [Planctomycetota bacterium]REK35997.1 MAG: hypothetical protein DWQ45_09910 [Planctomycetota bacterium]
MDALFPFGFPEPTRFYLALYVATLVLHVVFMHYVLAGTAFLAGRGLLARLGIDTERPAYLLREWMPLMLSAAITAGIAPLLFVQIVYQERFYTANLLLFNRWMAILPTLLIGFYMLYLLKVNADVLKRPLIRQAIRVLTFVCFAFVAWSWTENHLLSVQSLGVWTEHYASGALMFKTPELAPRLALWFCGSFPTLAAWLAWQIRLTATDDEHREIDHPSVARLLAGIGLVGLLSAALCAAAYYAMLGDAERELMTGPPAGPWFIIAIVGAVIQSAGWIVIWKQNALPRGLLLIVSIALLVTLCGTAVVREAIRLARVDITTLYNAHTQAAAVSGLGAFVFFLVVNTALMLFCIRLVRTKVESRGTRV